MNQEEARGYAVEMLRIFDQMHKNHMHQGKREKERSQKSTDSMRGEPMVMRYIDTHDGRAIPNEMSKELGISTARITKVLDSLEKKEFVIRNVDPSDRRRQVISITEKGRKFNRARNKEIVDECIHLMNYLGEEDSKELIRIMGRLTEYQPTLPPPEEDKNLC